ncbi:hypothetical protein [Halorientalis litorea]|jgi:hypothetical protein|nr:hypothetical protein [Halorientalis litorea]
MSVVLAASESTVQTGIINLAGAIVGLGGLALVAAWWAYLYR